MNSKEAFMMLFIAFLMLFSYGYLQEEITTISASSDSSLLTLVSQIFPYLWGFLILAAIAGVFVSVMK